MLFKDLGDDCTGCPFLHDLCPGVVTSDGRGNLVEPPCTSWNPEDDMNELYRQACTRLLAFEKREDERIRRNAEKRKKNAEKAAKAREARNLTW